MSNENWVISQSRSLTQKAPWEPISGHSESAQNHVSETTSYNGSFMKESPTILIISTTGHIQREDGAEGGQSDVYQTDVYRSAHKLNVTYAQDVRLQQERSAATIQVLKKRQQTIIILIIIV